MLLDTPATFGFIEYLEGIIACYILARIRLV